MSFFEYLSITTLGIVIASIILFFVLPALELPRKKFLIWVRKKTTIENRKYKDTRLLDEIEKPLLIINSLSRFPDKPIKEIEDILYEIGEKAKQIKTKKYKYIKKKLIIYSEKVNKLHINMRLKDKVNLLVKNGAFKLVEEIRKLKKS